MRMKAAYTIRGYLPEDFPAYLRLLALAESLEPAGRGISPEEVTASLNRPGYSPERELIVAEIGGSLVAYLDTVPELGIGRVIVKYWVVPEHRRHGLATRLMERAVRRARELGARTVQMNIPDDSKGARQLALRLGFEFTRRFLKLRLSLVGWSQLGNLGGVDFYDLEQVGLEGLADIQNRAFAQAWGYCPNTIVEIACHLRENGNSPEDIIFAHQGNQMVGYCWTKPGCGSGERPGMGQVFMLGVDPEYRGTGLGKKLMLAGLAYLKSKGLKVAWLEVDGENEHALGLYRSLGFRRYTSSSWYQKLIG